ncbi:hypothetical protein [Cupriavidus taiwanensis]|uniref:hypothetical protein n=1 Tax=Cupriavidus taiwanensis TaxID=164546 RepID=UPI001558AC60|nr:hypothetical protein [Cupriavidus taiwanensis]
MADQIQNDGRLPCALPAALSPARKNPEDRRQIRSEIAEGDKIDEDRYNSALFVIR